MNAMNKRIALNVKKFRHALDKVVIVCPQVSQKYDIEIV